MSGMPLVQATPDKGPPSGPAAHAEATCMAQDAAVFRALERGQPSDEQVYGREHQTQDLTDYLKLLVQQRRSGSIVLSGPAGAGKTLTALAVLHKLGKLPGDDAFMQQRPCFIYLPHTDAPASAWCPRITHAISTFPHDQGQQLYEPEQRYLKMKIDWQENLAALQAEVTQGWDPHGDLRPGMFVVILDNMERVSTRLDDVRPQMQDLFALTKVQASRLILIAISSGDRSDLERLGLHDHKTLLFPAYSGQGICSVIKHRLSKLDGVIDPEALQHLANQDKAVQGEMVRAFDICKNAYRMERQAEQGVTAASSEAGYSKGATASSQLLGPSQQAAEKPYLIGLSTMQQAVLDATPAQSEADITTDFEERLEAKRQRIAAEESLGTAKDWQKLGALKEEVLCQAPQYSNFDWDALPGAAKRKLHCIRDLPRNSQAVLCAAIVLMGMELKPKEKETIKVPVLDEAGEDVGWKRVESKNGCVVPKDPDAPPKDAVHKYCKLDKLEKMCCSAFRNELFSRLYGDDFGIACNNLVKHGIMRRSNRNGNPQKLQLLWQEWHFRAAFEGNQLMHQLYDSYLHWICTK